MTTGMSARSGSALSALEHRPAVDPGHHHVEQDGARPEVARECQALLASRGGPGREALAVQEAGHQVTLIGIVIDDEHEIAIARLARRHRRSRSPCSGLERCRVVDGTRTVKLLPRPCWLATSTSPPSRSAKALVRDRPSPVPPNLRVVELSACWKRWNSLSSCSGGHADACIGHAKDDTLVLPPAIRRATPQSVMVPPSVNFAALPSRLSRI